MVGLVVIISCSFNFQRSNFLFFFIGKMNENTDNIRILNTTGFEKGNKVFSHFLAQLAFTQVPPKKVTAKLGESLTMICKATTSGITWRKVNQSLPQFRTTNHGGRLRIRDLQSEDSGVYECKASSIKESLRRSVEVLVLCEYL